MREVLLAAQAEVKAPSAQVRQWFIDLEAHPERYVFDTHAGFLFVSGGFGKVGARFETRERFWGLPFVLRFELAEVGQLDFRFRLLRPALPVWGAFRIRPSVGGISVLELTIGVAAQRGAWLLRLPPIRGAVQRQIDREVAHIKSAIETPL